MDHPFITSIVEAYYNDTKQQLSLVHPLYEGGEVTKVIGLENKIPDEKNVAHTVY